VHLSIRHSPRVNGRWCWLNYFFTREIGLMATLICRITAEPGGHYYRNVVLRLPSESGLLRTFSQWRRSTEPVWEWVYDMGVGVNTV